MFAGFDLNRELTLQVLRAHPNRGNAMATHGLKKLPTVEAEKLCCLSFGEAVEPKELHDERLSDPMRHLCFLPTEGAEDLVWKFDVE